MMHRIKALHKKIRPKCSGLNIALIRSKLRLIVCPLTSERNGSAGRAFAMRDLVSFVDSAVDNTFWNLLGCSGR